MKQSTLDLLVVFLSEVLATGLLVFLGCMGCIKFGSEGPTHLIICLNFGLAVMLLINIFGCVSGAHMNPAVTLAAVIYKLITIPTGVAYVIAQVLGAYMGYGLLRFVTPMKFFAGIEGFCVTVPSDEISILQAFMVEFVITAVLILVCCGVWDPRNSKLHDSVPLRFGLAVTCLAISGGPFTGGSMNPARSFGPALWNLHFQNHWIYWVAPLSASFITAIGFKMVFRKDPALLAHVVEEVPLQVNNKNQV
ncbi:unnamed protein product [Diamesa serratosioi]